MKCNLTLFALLPWVGSLALAAEPDPQALRACAAEQDDGLRLACYDRLVRGAAAEPQAAGAPAKRDERVEERFGARGGELARRQAREDEKVNLKEVTAKIAALAQRPRGERVFTLDNGQVWVEKRRTSYLPVEVGETITIEGGALGSYRLSESSGRSTQVQRVQ